MGVVAAGLLAAARPGPAALREDPEETHESARPTDDRSAIDARSLYLEHCASCHGETGDGKGWTELDRPARSFQDGGFSFGNTPETIARTIAGGIPGTPMPGFDAALGVAEREALARHVISLGPPELPAPERTEMIVSDRPLVVRGLLPPIARGAPQRPRGLVVGTLDGLSFEYDAADVRLVGVRQGRFVDRRDWGDRGGSALKPLGMPVYIVEDGKPGPRFAWRSSDEDEFINLHASLVATRVIDGRATVVQALHASDGRILARVEETPRQVVTSHGSGFLLAYCIEPFEEGNLVVRFPVPEAIERVNTTFAVGPSSSDPGRRITRGTVVSPDERSVLFIRHLESFAIQMTLLEGTRGASVWLTTGRVVQLDIAAVLLTSPWDLLSLPAFVGEFDR